MFKALTVYETPEGFQRKIETITKEALPKGELLIEVHYSSLNYKDALSSIGNRGVTKNYPHTPGIDAAGLVLESDDPTFKKGDEVLVTGYDFGMNTHGGFSQIIRVPSSWALHLPKGLSLKESMMLGTAGLTAALSVNETLPYAMRGKKRVFVSGASGGVGSFAIKILHELGFEITAPLRRESSRAFLENLGVKHFVDMEQITGSVKRALLPEKYDAAIDTTGGDNLSYALKSVVYGGAVSSCGNAASGDLSLTVYPFILRGVRLIGIDSVLANQELRKEIWENLAGPWKSKQFEDGITEIGLEELPEAMDKMLRGEHQGRTLVNLKK